MSMHLKLTERGFVVGKFIDHYEQPCSIQQSSLASIPAIWLGRDTATTIHPITGTDCGARMHLTQEMAADLIPLLQAFVETGDLPVPADHSDT